MKSETGQPGVELTPQEALRVTTVVLDLTDKITQYQLALRQARRQLEMFMADGERNRLTVTLAILEKTLGDQEAQAPTHIETLALQAYTEIGNCSCAPTPALCPRCELTRDMLTALAEAYPDYDDVGPLDEYRGQ